MGEKKGIQVQPQIELIVDTSSSSVELETNQNQLIFSITKQIISPFFVQYHAGYFRVSISLCSQALLWKSLSESPEHPHPLRKALSTMLPSAAFILLWSLAVFMSVSLSLLYIFRCIFHFNLVKAEFLDHIGVNYLFVPWISCLLLIQSSPFISPHSGVYLVLWCLFVTPILILDVKIYGQWFTKGKRFLSTVANPTSLLSVIGNLVAARAAARMGWNESATCMFSLGMAHYLVLFVTLYQRLQGCNGLPVMLRPVFFLFFAAPSMASLAWSSISGSFDIAAKMLFFLSLFLFMSLVCRPKLFKKSMRKFNVAWWAYSFPLTILALASAEYAQEIKGSPAHRLTLVLSAISVLVTLILMVFTACNTNSLLPPNDSSLKSHNNDTTMA